MSDILAWARKLACIGFWVCIPASSVFAEKNELIAEAAAGQVAGAVETIKTLAAIESGSGNASGLAKVAEHLDQRLRALGFAVTREPSRVDVGADTIVAVRASTGTQKIMLMAHMDAVFEAGTLASMPIRLEEGKLYGPGVVDDKGGIAVILHSLQILVDQGWDDYASITVVLNPDEETGSAGSGALISKLAADMDTVLSFEVGGSEARGMAWILAGTAAYAQVTLTVTGTASHAGSAPGAGRNAILELSHQLLATKGVADGVPGAQLNWTDVVSDGAYNIIPDLAVAIGDARITEDGAEDALLAALQSKIAESNLIPGTQTTVSLEILRPGFKASRQGRAVALLAQNFYREVSGLNFYIVDMANGATDAGYAAVSDHPVVLEGLGPSGADYHSTSEYLDVGSLMPSMYQIARLLIELGNRSTQ